MEAHKRNTTQQQIKCSATFGKWNCVFELVRVIALQNFENGTVYSNLSMSLKRTQAQVSKAAALSCQAGKF